MHKREFLKLLGAGSVAVLVGGCDKNPPTAAATGDFPKEFRIVGHGAWGSSRATGIMGVLQAQGYLEEEFANKGVKIDFKPMDKGGIGINEAIANGLVDASCFGGFPQIIGRARGLKTRVLASQGYHYSYFAVRKDFPGRKPEDLAGATIGVGFGGYGHLSTAIMLHEHGIGLKQVKLVNMSGTDSSAALAAGRIDGYLGDTTLFALEEQGLVRIIYATKGRQTHASGFGGLFATADFAERYPRAVHHLVRAFLKASHWAALPENRAAYFELQTRNSTTPLRYLERDHADRDLKEALNPVVDDYLVARYQEAVDFCLENAIIKNPIDVNAWIDRSTIRAALTELGLLNYWTHLDAAGNPVAAV
ncbi:ABC transporter substrate-binding protein [uncultured Thiodictyon sp.]|uniref:ABC transporter substrate-binding protein n=1 Tax=uncultured Thiodictyon sp. TaxID=1846217 RepID=UPI0025D350EC|nr:ABC transporter substrate-binding protein [uncultured Thiodictyon sp.]